LGGRGQNGEKLGGDTANARTSTTRKRVVAMLGKMVFGGVAENLVVGSIRPGLRSVREPSLACASC